MNFFAPLRKIANVFITISSNDIIFQVLGSNENLRKEILDLNRLGQLFKKGEDSKGTDLNTMTQSGFGYSQFTINEKKKKNQPTNRVTLFDTGDFYKSFRLVIRPTYMEIEADAQKDDGNLFDDFGNDIVGLSEDNLDLLRGKLLPLVLNYLNSKLL